MARRATPGRVGRFQALLGGVKAYIADGHHRHATALRYRDAIGPDGAWTLGYFTPMEAPGLLVQPYHRILSEGPSLEEARARSSRARSALARAAGRRRGGRRRGGLDGALRLRARRAGRRARSSSRPSPGSERLLVAAAPRSLRALDTYFLHHAVLGPLLGVPDDGGELRALAGRGRGGARERRAAASPC